MTGMLELLSVIRSKFLILADLGTGGHGRRGRNQPAATGGL